MVKLQDDDNDDNDDNVENEMFNELITDVIKETISLPNYVISGSGLGWFLDPERNQVVCISRGTEIIPLPGDTDNLDRCLVRASYRFLLVPECEVQEVGWN